MIRRILVPTDSPNAQMAFNAGYHLPSAVGADCVTVRGDPNATIVEYALDNKADLMVVGLRGSGGINKVRASLLGSVAQAMIRKSPCPVLVVRPDHKIEQA
jgi:nucleotide-binding universal stress UspA family protein